MEVFFETYIFANFSEFRPPSELSFCSRFLETAFLIVVLTFFKLDSFLNFAIFFNFRDVKDNFRDVKDTYAHAVHFCEFQ